MPRPELKHVVEAIEGPLAALGYRKRRLDSFTHDFDADILGLIEVMGSKKPHGLQTQVFLGVRHQSLHRLCCELTDYKFHPYDPAQVKQMLGPILPRPYRTDAGHWWVLRDEDDLARRAPMIVRAIKEVGIPYIEKHASLYRIVKFVQDHRVADEAVVGLYLRKGLDPALEELEKHLTKFSPLSHAGAIRFRAFARRFLDHLETDGAAVPPKRLAAIAPLLREPGQ